MRVPSNEPLAARHILRVDILGSAAREGIARCAKHLVFRWRHSGLRARLLSMVLIAILPLFGLVILRGVEERKRLTAEAYVEATRVVNVAVSEQERLVADAQYLLWSLFRLPEVW